MEFKCFPLLSNESKKLMQRRKHKVGKRTGKTYHYQPQQRLIERLAFELKMSPGEVRRQIANERLDLLRQIYGQNQITEKDI